MSTPKSPLILILAGPRFEQEQLRRIADLLIRHHRAGEECAVLDFSDVEVVGETATELRATMVRLLALPMGIVAANVHSREVASCLQSLIPIHENLEQARRAISADQEP